MVLCLWKGGSVVIGVAHHHPQLHRLGDLSAIWTLDYNADLELTRRKDKHKVCLQSVNETDWLELHDLISVCWCCSWNVIIGIHCLPTFKFVYL